MSDDVNGLVSAYRLDGNGGALALDWDGIKNWKPEDGMIWVHLQRTDPHAQQWLRDESGLDPLIAEAMLEEETRPRVVEEDTGLVCILRGVNLNPGAQPNDMISVRGWFSKDRIITTRRYSIRAVRAISDALEAGKGPKTPGELLTRLTMGLTDRMQPIVDELGEAVDGLEESMLENESASLRGDLRRVRGSAITLRRYLAPQRDAVGRIAQSEFAWIKKGDRAALRENQDRLQRLVEEMDEARERAAVVQDELATRIGEQMNRTMYTLTVIAAIMLPLGFLTGLLGINVGGMPGADNPQAFWIVCTMMVLIGVLEIWLFKRIKWL